MGVTGVVSNGYNKMSAGVDSARQATQAKLDKLPETKSGRRALSCMKFLKKVVNAPVKLVKAHPKATIAVGLITTVIGGVTANLPAVGIGVGLFVSGFWARSANHHAQAKNDLTGMKTDIAEIKANLTADKKP